MQKVISIKKVISLLVLNLFLLSTFLGIINVDSAKNISALEEYSGIVFSHDGGFYTETISLELSVNDSDKTIYYTTDGTTPTLDSAVYENKITIKSEYISPNNPVQIIAEDITPTTPLSFIMTNPLDAKDNYIWIKPNEDIFKATVLKAVTVDGDGNFSQVTTNTYFVSDDMENRYSLPVISISFEIEDFFDYNTGIYVPGHHYYINGFGDDWWGRNNANYFQGGEDWERPVYLEFYESDGTLGFEQILGARIHGSGSRALPQKSIRLYARNDYDTENNAINYDIFDGRARYEDKTALTRFKRLILRNGGQLFYENLINDSLSQTLTEHTSVYTQSYRPANVFLNGEYWGIHFIMERLDSRYFESHYDLQRDEIVILDNDALISHGEEGDEDHFLKMRNFIESHDLTNPLHYEYVKTQMDIINFIEYQIIQIFTANYDWPGNNVKFWRTKNDYDENAPYYKDGRWRWIAFDMDFTFGFHNQADNSIRHATRYNGPDWPNPDWSTVIFRSLLRNENFETLFVQMFTDAMNTYLHSDRINEIIDKMEMELMPDIGEHISRWVRYPEPSVSGWRNNINVVRSFVNTRQSNMLRELQGHFKLNRPARMTFEVSDVEHGLLEINNNLISNSTPGYETISYPFNALYFPDIPLTLNAVPNEGYKFARWEGLSDLEDPTDKTITIYPNHDETKIVAIFEPSIPIVDNPETLTATILILIASIILGIFLLNGIKKKPIF